jgi:hypothetical protein
VPEPTIFAGLPPNWAFGSHERWTHADGRAVTIPIHSGREIGSPLFNQILAQLGIGYAAFLQLK